MYYDDGYDELEYIEKAELPEGYVRAYQLNNGDVIQILNLLLEFEDGIFYEVKEAVGLINPYHERTGRTFLMNELNEMVK